VSRRVRLVVATTNRGKLAELADLVRHLPLEVRPVSEVLATPPHVVEDGATFVDNALKKARTVARATGVLTLADDSGLEVDALGGRPGVRSARFARDGATDAENIAALLAALGGVAPNAGTTPLCARFRCVLALVDPRGPQAQEHTVEGVCEGTIERSPHGTGGFGYDPIFLVAGSDKTMAELPLEEKNRLSHRARAWAALLPVLEKVLEER